MEPTLCPQAPGSRLQAPGCWKRPPSEHDSCGCGGVVARGSRALVSVTMPFSIPGEERGKGEGGAKQRAPSSPFPMRLRGSHAERFEA